MNHDEASRFEFLFQRYVNELTLQGKQPKTIEAYALSVRQAATFFDCCPEHLTVDQLKAFFLHLLQTRSWSKVKIARNGLQNFYRLVLQRDWQWVDILKPPKTYTLQGRAERGGSIAPDQCDDAAALSGVLSGDLQPRPTLGRDAGADGG